MTIRGSWDLFLSETLPVPLEGFCERHLVIIHAHCPFYDRCFDDRCFYDMCFYDNRFHDARVYSGDVFRLYFYSRKPPPPQPRLWRRRWPQRRKAVANPRRWRRNAARCTSPACPRLYTCGMSLLRIFCAAFCHETISMMHFYDAMSWLQMPEPSA